MSDELRDALHRLVVPIIAETVNSAVEMAALNWRWRTPEQMAALLDITPAAVRARARNGQLPARIVGNRIYVDVREYDRLIAESPRP